MRLFTSLSVSLALTLSAGLAAEAGSRANIDLSGFQYRHESKSAFTCARSSRIAEINAMMQADVKGRRLKAAEAAEAPKPFFSLGPTSLAGDLDGPDGEEWYYTADLVYTEIPPHGDIQFTDRILQSYTFNIYDASMNLVGTISDKMAYRDEEVRVANCEIAPFISRNFFNTDDKLEVVIGLAVNAQVGYNNYRSLIYSIGGEKTAEGHDKVVLSYDKLIGDVVEAPTDGSTADNFFITFLEDDIPSDEETATMGFWDYLCANKIKFTIYSKAAGAGVPELIYERSIPQIQLPGDQQSSPFMITLTDHGQLFFVISSYDEPFYNPYNDPVSDKCTMRSPNKLNVEFLKLQPDGSIKTDYTTSIPVVKADNSMVPASYFSVGGMRYRDDIKFGGYGSPEGKAALIVTREDYMSASDSYISSYYVYSHEGKLLHILFEGADSSLALSEIDGCEPQQMFVSSDEYGYEFHFVDLLSAKKVLGFSSQFEIDEDSDPESLTANIDRCPDGAGSYVYVDEMRVPTVLMSEPDEDGKTHEIDSRMRFMWINRNGTFRRIDQLSMGTNVNYALSYIESKALDPTSFNSDSRHEYMVLIKRATAADAAVEELLIGQAITPDLPEGRTLLLLGPDERGILNGIVPDFYAKDPKMTIRYYDQATRSYAMDFYNLPLDEEWSGIEAPEAPGTEGSGITVSGTSVVADGSITIYSISGAVVASGTDSVDLAGLNRGVYIASANGKAQKIFIK
ncbi:MAG: T9SS type A sorting domain-containing protein [Muribaculaceae bacterium]|nr:T9SS type A sorting domain-containing protein [Muribaculaceae bacterium]